MNTDNSQVEIISVHVPKTAGTAFRRVLEQVYGLEALILDYPGKHRKRFDNQWEVRKSKIKVIHGHFDIHKYDQFFPQAKTIAWIRHPIHRLISHYFFWLSLPLDKIENSSQRLLVENKISLLEFSQLDDIKNLVTRFLNSRKVTDFHFVGIQEFFQEDLIDLKRQLGWGEFNIEHTNKNTYSNYEKNLESILSDEKLISKLEEINTQDIEFYQAALKAREERINDSKKIVIIQNKSSYLYSEKLSQISFELTEISHKLEKFNPKIQKKMTVKESHIPDVKSQSSDPGISNVSQDNSKTIDIQNDSRLFQIQNAIVERMEIFRGQFEFTGGPVFPNDIPGIFRHRRADHRGQPKYLDNNFRSSKICDSIDDSKFHHGKYIYGGFFNGHFGHVLTESIHRLWAFNPDTYNGIVFSVLSATPKRVPFPAYIPPEWFTQVLDILDIPIEFCIFVTDCCMFENLVIPEPGSELSLGSKEWYRSYVENLQHKIFQKTDNFRKDLPKLKLFLGKSHIPLHGTFAGEKYLERLLVDEGYISFKPENHNFIQQLAYLINAKKIVFTEGSSIYSLELMRYLDTEIACIPRRSDNQLLYPHLSRKCRHYIVAGNVDNCERLGSYNQKDGANGISISKRPYQIIESLRNHQFAKLPEWEENHFLDQERYDIMTYISKGYSSRKKPETVHCLNVIERYLQVRSASLEQSQESKTIEISKKIDLKIRSSRLNTLASINQSSSYLEIGVHKGQTFKEIKVEKKVAVDPKFLLNQNEYDSKNVVFLEITSDEFFRNFAKDFPEFDLIYLDGLHCFEQTYRDFCASIACAHSKTIWLIDDTCPGSYAQAQSSHQLAKRLKQLSGEKDGSWMGDVFKVVAAIHDFFPQYSFATFPDHGQTVVWKKWRTDFQPKWNNLEMISRLEYADFVELQGTLFKRQAYEKIFEIIRRDFG